MPETEWLVGTHRTRVYVNTLFFPIIWTGWGFLGWFLGMAVFAAVHTIAYYGMGADFFRIHEGAISLASGFLAAFAVFVVGVLLRAHSGYGLAHTLYFVPMHYWAIPWILLGLVGAWLSSLAKHDPPAGSPPAIEGRGEDLPEGRSPNHSDAGRREEPW